MKEHVNVSIFISLCFAHKYTHIIQGNLFSWICSTFYVDLMILSLHIIFRFRYKISNISAYNVKPECIISNVRKAAQNYKVQSIIVGNIATYVKIYGNAATIYRTIIDYVLLLWTDFNIFLLIIDIFFS